MAVRGCVSVNEVYNVGFTALRLNSRSCMEQTARGLWGPPSHGSLGMGL